MCKLVCSTGGPQVADTFAKTYPALYNSAGSEVEMEALKSKMRGIIQHEGTPTPPEVAAPPGVQLREPLPSHDSREEVNRLTWKVVKQAV